MAKAPSIIVKAKDGEDFATIAGMTMRRFSINGEAVPFDELLRWRTLLSETPIKRAGMSGRGLFKDASAVTLVRQTFFDGAVKDYQIVVPDFGTIEGAFQITSMEFAGEHNGEVTYELSFESAGPQSFASQ